MSNTFDAITFGSATIDVFLESPQFGKKLELAYDSKIEVEQKLVSCGGGSTNVAAGLSRLGLKTAAVARLGQDQFAPLVKEELIKERVEVRLLCIKPGDKTDSSTILVNSSGQKVILVSRGPTRLEAQDINWSQLSAKQFHIASLEGNLKLASKLINYANNHDIKVSWNPGSRELAQKNKLITLLNKIDILILNQEEIEKLTGLKMTNPFFWPEIYKLPVPLLTITQGQKGCFLAFPEQKQKTHLKAIKTKVIETTGAGDAFCAGLIAGLFYQETAQEAALWGLANGASVVAQYGAKAGLLTRGGIKKWLKKR
ncbi:carbohydrate kinase family protein [Candidatus Shapirobacteria bacterium]|nr:carbohydrate kinase family protein [Candidatus Shapirobacteria bacterium]